MVEHNSQRSGRSGSRKQALDVYRALSDLVRGYQFRDRDRVCCHDITITQCYALEMLVERGPLMLNELAAHLYLDKSTASRLVDALEHKAYAVRLTDPEDGRALMLKATRKGARLHQQIVQEIVGEEEELLAEFPPAVRRVLPEVLRRLAFAARKRSGNTASSCSGNIKKFTGGAPSR